MNESCHMYMSVSESCRIYMNESCHTCINESFGSPTHKVYISRGQGVAGWCGVLHVYVHLCISRSVCCSVCCNVHCSVCCRVVWCAAYVCISIYLLQSYV